MTTMKRSYLYGVLPLMFATAVRAADAEAVYSHKVSPAKPTAESEYVSVKQDQTAKLLTVPENASFVANSGRVVELESKRHSDIIWMETKDTATEHEAKSPSIKAYRGPSPCASDDSKRKRVVGKRTLQQSQNGHRS